MPPIPIHKAVVQSACGIFLKEVSPSSPQKPVGYAHRDDYYLFGIVNSGTCRLCVDFKEYRLSAGELICTHPGQVHRLMDAGDAAASLLFVDSVFVEPSDKQILAEYALRPEPLRINTAERAELKQIFAFISRRISCSENENSKAVVQNLSRAAVGMITEIIRNTPHRQPKSRRHLEIALAFRELLSKEHPVDRSPSRYAAALHISSGYLNEAIKDTTGESVSKYIQNELIVRAKRQLVYTPRNIREIAFDLGFDDYAYFTRLFTKIAGMNPTSYRKKYLE